MSKRTRPTCVGLKKEEMKDNDAGEFLLFVDARMVGNRRWRMSIRTSA